MNDLKFASRQLLKNPGFTVVAVITLALGIGATTALLSVAHAVILKSLPFGEPDRIVQVWGTRPAAKHFRARTSLLNFQDYKDQNQSFSHLAYYRLADFHFTGTPSPAEVRTGRVSEEFFDLMGVPPLLGRTFRPEENIPGRADVVVLSHDLWTRRFGGDTKLIGTTIGLEGKPYVLSGVMPPSFRFPERAEIWVPYAMTPDQIGTKRSDHFNFVVGRLKDGRSLAEAQAEFRGITERLVKAFPEANEGLGSSLVPLPEDLVSDFKPALMLLFSAVASVLLIACANVANLQLVRGLARQKEIALRAALGAGRRRLIRQLLVESVLLAVLGGALGVVLARLGLDAILALAPKDVPRIQEATLDSTVLLVSLGITVLTGIVFGMVPALATSRPDLVGPLKDGGTGSTDGAGRHRSRHALVIGEIAMAVVLLVTAGLLVRSFQKLGQVDLGFRAEDLTTVRVSLPWRYHVSGQDKAFFRSLHDRIRALPGAEKSALVCALPVADRQTTVWFKETGVAFEPGREPTAGFNYVTPSYLETMGIPLLRGRNLDDHDTDKKPRVLVVDETLAKQHFPGVDPVGKRVHIEGQGNEPFTIVGIAGHVCQRGADRGPMPQLYMHYQQINEASMWVVTRGAPALRGFEQAIAHEVQALDVDQSTGPMQTMEQHLGESWRLARFRTLLLSLLAAIALTLATIGIFGVIAFSTSQRMREFGLRIALGASRADLLRLVMGLGTRLTLIGVAIGMFIALGVTRWIKDMLFQVAPTDAWSFVSVAVIIGAAALTACYLPARRASRVDPMVALRTD